MTSVTENMIQEENDPITNQIYDIYVLKQSGIPLFAGCTATEYCRNHLDQHELISGFFSAMFSFSAESFRDDTLETMIYGDILLNFWEDADHELIFAFIHDRRSDINIIRQQLKQAHEVFIELYGDQLDTFAVDQSVFENYRDELNKRGIINSGLMDTSGMAKDIKPGQEQQKPGIVSWLRGLFSL